MRILLLLDEIKESGFTICIYIQSCDIKKIQKARKSILRICYLLFFIDQYSFDI